MSRSATVAATLGAGLLLTLTACSSSSESAAAPLPSISDVPTDTSSGGASPSATASAACANGVATGAVKAALVTADGRPGAAESPGSTFYGTCGALSYAVASFQPSTTASGQDSVAFQDNGAYPRFFVQTAGAWKEVGSASGPPGPANCAAFSQAPSTLLSVWGDCAVAAPSPSSPSPSSASPSSASPSSSSSADAGAAKAAALVQWKAGAQSDAADLGGYLTRAAGDLEAAVSQGATGADGFAAAAKQLRDLASIPETDVTSAQMQAAKTDIAALDAFFATPGLYS